MITGKGFWIWKLLDCEGGDPARIASAAQAAGLSHALIKIADGAAPTNLDNNTRVDLIPPVVVSLKAVGVQVWGWHYVYGYYPQQEADIAVRRTLELGLDGYVIDAEREFKQAGWSARAEGFAQTVRRGLASRGIPIALSSYRYPSLHREFPWRAFLAQCDFNFPQVYWEQSHNPADQLRRCVKEFSILAPVRPVMPAAPTYKTSGWAPTPQDLKTFLDAAREMNIQAVSFFSWDECRRDLPASWDVVAAETRWGVPATPPPEPPSEPQPDHNGLVGRVLVLSLNVRSGPGTAFPRVGALRQGDQVNILEVSGGDAWARIGDGRWCAIQTGGSRYLKIEQ